MSTSIPKSRMTAEARKAAIVAAAVRLFAEKGFRGTTTREIAAAVGVTEPVLYQHFAHKRDLYSAIIESICQTENNGDRQLERARSTGNDRAFFLRLGELLLDWHLEKPQVVRLLLYSALEGHELSELFFQRQMVVYYQMLTDYIALRMGHGAFRKMDPYMAARAFTGMIAHQGMVITVFGSRYLKGTPKQIVRKIVRIFLEGIQNPRATSA